MPKAAHHLRRRNDRGGALQVRQVVAGEVGALLLVAEDQEPLDRDVDGRVLAGAEDALRDALEPAVARQVPALDGALQARGEIVVFGSLLGGGFALSTKEKVMG